MKSTIIRRHGSNDSFSYPNSTGSTIAGGAIVRVGGNGGILARVHDDILNGATGAAMFQGEIETDKLNTDVFTLGQEVGWDDTNSRLTANTSLGVLGVMSEAAGNGTTRGRVKLTPSKQRVLLITLPYDVSSDSDQPYVVIPAGITGGRVIGVTGVPQVLEGSAAVASIKKAASGTAISAGVALHSGTFDLNAGLHTNQVLTLSAVAGALDIAGGDKIGWDFPAALTNAVGTATIAMLV